MLLISDKPDTAYETCLKYAPKCDGGTWTVVTSAFNRGSNLGGSSVAQDRAVHRGNEALTSADESVRRQGSSSSQNGARANSGNRRNNIFATGSADESLAFCKLNLNE